MPSMYSERLQDSEELKGFSTYNLGIALLQDGRQRGSDPAAGQGRAGEGP